MQLPLSVAVALVAVAALAVQCSASPQQWALSTVDSLARSSHLLPAAKELLQKYRFRLVNHRVHERTPRELMARLAGQLRSTGAVRPELDAMFETILRKAPETWQSEATEPSNSVCTHDAPEVALSELSSACSSGNVHLCQKAVADYCARVTIPGKRLAGAITDEANGLVRVACREGLVTSEEFSIFQVSLYREKYCTINNHCTQAGAQNYCQSNYGMGYTGLVVVNKFSAPFITFVYVCLKQARMEWVSTLVLAELNPNCNSVSYPEGAGSFECTKAISTFCRRYFGHAGGIPQGIQLDHSQFPILKTNILVSCYDADYTGEAYINRDIRFFEARAKVKDVCSLDFQVDSGKILNSVPDDLKVETYDNRRSSVELRDSFTISRSVTTENTFSHSHTLSIGTELKVKSGVPFIAESEIKVSLSYTAEFSLSETNSRTTQYSQTSEVVVPPGHAIRKKATIMRSKMDVPWRAKAVNGLGKVVNLTGTWIGVDVSDIRVTQEDL